MRKHRSRQRVAVNGLGRIGRLVLRKLVSDGRFEVVAVNDVASLEMLAHLLRHSSEHASIFDATQTKVAQASEGRYLVEAAAWFDNETSYVARFVELAAYLGTLYHLADLG